MAANSRDKSDIDQSVDGSKNVNQAARDIIYYIFHIGQPGDSAEKVNLPALSGKALGILAAIVIVLLILISQGVEDQAARDSQDGAHSIPFVEPGDPWPAGATKEQITYPIVAKLVSCSKATALKPLTCPNANNDSAAEASGVHWELVGDPGDGAAISFHGTKADVIGHAAMTVSYEDFTGPKFELHELQYRTTVDWNNGNPQIISPLSPTKITPKKAVITKRQPSTEAWSNIESALRKAFARCVASRKIPMPPTCPRNLDADTDLGRGRWSFDGDPLLNTASSYDSSWGLIHVKGNYAFNFTHNVLFFGPQSESRSGVYDAALVATGAHVRVLEIVKH